MFNKKKIKKNREPEIVEIEEEEEEDPEDDEEVEDEEVLDDEEESEDEEEEEEEVQSVKKKKPLIKKSTKPVKSVAKIIEGALMDGGWIRYTILANKSMGEIGEEFPID